MVKEVLVAARILIQDEKNWCQKLMSDCEGRHCALGAIFAAAKDINTVSQVWEKLQDVMGQSVGDYNDSHSHTQVLAMFDKAIQQEKV